MNYKGDPTNQYYAGQTMSAKITGIGATINVLDKLGAELDSKAEQLVSKLVDEGVQIAKREVPVYTGELQASIHGEKDGQHGEIVAGTDHALFVEFGTGIRGRETRPFTDGTVHWAYDINERNWVGRYANPFMYRTARQVEEMIPDVAEEIFKVRK